MKTALRAILILSILFGDAVAQGEELPRFEDYEVSSYRGAIRPPKWIHHVGDDEWRDHFGKLVAAPEINFAGKYFIAVHSCGTSCTYYTLTDLSSGRDLDVLDRFSAGGPRQRTREGHEYRTKLFSRPNSTMLVAQYYVALRQGSEECHERAFVFEDGRLKPITRTRRACREF